MVYSYFLFALMISFLQVQVPPKELGTEKASSSGIGWWPPYPTSTPARFVLPGRRPPLPGNHCPPSPTRGDWLCCGTTGMPRGSGRGAGPSVPWRGADAFPSWPAGPPIGEPSQAELSAAGQASRHITGGRDSLPGLKIRGIPPARGRRSEVGGQVGV